MRGTALPVAIRKGVPEDAADVADVYLTSRGQAAPYIPRTIHAADEVRAWFASIVLVEREVWVAVTGDRIVAMMVLRGDWIDQLYVRPEHQRRGVGGALLRHAKTQRRALRLYAFQSNQPARDFYEKHGFTALAYGDGTGNEEGAPDVLYDWRG